MDDFNIVLYSLIGKKIKELRLKKKLNQTQLSDKISNLGRTSISNIEKGKQQPPLHVIYLLCNELDIDIHSILPTFSDILDEVKRRNKDDIEDYINDEKIDSETRKLLEELINSKYKK